MRHRSHQLLEDGYAALARMGLVTDGDGKRFDSYRQGGASLLLTLDRVGRGAGADTLGLRLINRVRSRETVRLSSEILNSLEDAVGEFATGQVRVSGLRVGPGGRSKLTVVLANDQGLTEVVAKFPITELAVDSIENEERSLQRLNSNDRLTTHTPSVLGAAGLSDRRGILLSAGPTRRIRGISTEVATFLRTLHQATEHLAGSTAPKPTARWAESIEDLRPLLGRELSAGLLIATEVVASSIEGAVPHVTAHGDFTRWNLRQNPNGVFVFDWEACMQSAFPYHDLFHFFSAEAALLGRPSPVTPSRWGQIRTFAEVVAPEWTPLLGPLYAAYLVHTVLWYARSRISAAEEDPGPFWRFLSAEAMAVSSGLPPR